MDVCVRRTTCSSMHTTTTVQVFAVSISPSTRLTLSRLVRDRMVMRIRRNS
jgi:hypothetical protein